MTNQNPTDSTQSIPFRCTPFAPLSPANSLVVVLLGRQIHQANGYADPNHWHNIIARFHHLSAKSIFHYFRDSTYITKYFTDLVLVNYFQHLAPYHFSPDDLAGDPGHLFGGVGLRQSVPEPGKDTVMEPGLSRNSDRSPVPKNVITGLPAPGLDVEINDGRPARPTTKNQTRPINRMTRAWLRRGINAITLSISFPFHPFGGNIAMIYLSIRAY